MKLKPLNIIVAGTGGQGVITLSNVIRKLATKNNLACEGATFKGGAQRMGTVYTELRLRPKADQMSPFSSQIPIGEADVILGLEPWETLRFAKYGNKDTRIVSNSTIEKLYVERMDKTDYENPINQLRRLFTHALIEDFTTLAITEEGTRKATNLMVLRAAIKANYLPFTMDQLNELS